MTINELVETIQKFGTVIIKNAEGKEQIIHFPQINFNGCAFNFSKDAAAESHYINGDDIYNPKKNDE